MTHALPLAPPQRRGACPSLDAPMPTGDGLLARIRLRGGALTPAQLDRIATLAAVHGNGLVEVTARGNLQVRGLTDVTAAPFAREVEASIAIERGLVVETPPFAGIDPAELADPRSLAAAIRALPLPVDRLGPKVTVTIDGNGQLGLSGLKADVALLAVTSDLWQLSVAGAAYGPFGASDAVDAAADLLSEIATLGPDVRARDVSPLLTRLRLGTPLQPGRYAPGSATQPIGRFVTAAGRATGIALPFGAAESSVLRALAEAAQQDDVDAFHLAPYHGILALGATPHYAERAARLGLITVPTDPRRRISACIGSDGCASGHIPARRDAARLARHLPQGLYLHVSGCSKGCAHPRAADVTLVGGRLGYGLVIGGRAGDTPQAVLPADDLESALAARWG